MSKQEQEPLQDDAVVEMVDLDRDHDNATPDTPPLSRLHWTRWSQLSLRQRILRLAVTACVIVLTLLVILDSSTATRNATVSLFLGPLPTPTATLAPRIDLFYTQGIPPWGQLYVDGHPLSQIPVAGVTPPLRLARGHHQLLVRANPFEPIPCTVSVPVAHNDTCHLSTTDQLLSAGWQITFFESLGTLPTGVRTALVQATQAELDSQQSIAPLQPGEQYIHLGVHHTIDTATQPLQATLRFRLIVPEPLNVACAKTDEPTDPACATLLQHCYLFCSLAGQMPFISTLNRQFPLSSSANSWNVQVAVRAFWSYTTLDHKVVASDQPDTLPDITNFEHLVTLGITWDGAQWHVAVIGPGIPVGNDLACISAEDNFQKVLVSSTSSLSSSFAALEFASGSLPAAGCLVIVQQLLPVGTTPSSSTSTTAYCLYRFGLFLAVNDLAHRLWPQLPVANSYERSLAQHWATLFAGSGG